MLKFDQYDSEARGGLGARSHARTQTRRITKRHAPIGGDFRIVAERFLIRTDREEEQRESRPKGLTIGHSARPIDRPVWRPLLTEFMFLFIA
jgi:hypothetical protein